MDVLPLSDAELDELDALVQAASPDPWQAFCGAGIGGPAFIRLSNEDAMPEMYVRHDDKPAPDADLDFIAAARNYVPRLLAEIREQRH
jgi:hypothetical protein